MKSKPSMYEDMLYLSRPQSAHQKMSMEARAAQFAPFAALSGHKEMVAEKERTTESKRMLTEDEKRQLDMILEEAIRQHEPWLKVIYFVPDDCKPGGCYEQFEGQLKRIDPILHVLFFKQGNKIKTTDIVHLDIIDKREI